MIRWSDSIVGGTGGRDWESKPSLFKSPSLCLRGHQKWNFVIEKSKIPHHARFWLSGLQSLDLATTLKYNFRRHCPIPMLSHHMQMHFCHSAAAAEWQKWVESHHKSAAYRRSVLFHTRPSLYRGSRFNLNRSFVLWWQEIVKPMRSSATRRWYLFQARSVVDHGHHKRQDCLIHLTVGGSTRPSSPSQLRLFMTTLVASAGCPCFDLGVLPFLPSLLVSIFVTPACWRCYCC